ncbi:YdcF family protein [Aliihoeflea sp. PC F10.4]
MRGRSAYDLERVGGRRSLPALARVSIIVALCLGFVFAGGFLVFATHVGRLQTPADPGDADAIIVLTGGVARLDAAMQLLQEGRGKRLLISGVNPVARPLDIQRATGADEDLFSCCVDIDRDATNTIGNAAESAKWLEQNAFRSAIVVTNNYHMPRSLLEMGHALQNARLTPYPVVTNRLDGGQWLGSRSALRVLFTEYTKYLAALARTTIMQPRDGNPASVVVEAGASRPAEP